MYSRMRFLTFSRPDRRALAPRQVGHPLDVVARHLVLGAGRVHRAHPPELTPRGLLGLVRHVGPGHLVPQVLDLVVVVGLAELAPDRLHLLAEEELALRARHLLLHHRRDLLLDLVDLRLATDELAHPAQPLAHVELLEDLLLERRVDRQVRADEIGERAGVLHVLEHRARLARQVRQQIEELAPARAEAAGERVDLDVLHRRLVDARDARGEERVAPVRLDDAHAADALQHHRVVAGAEPDDLEHPRDRAERVDLVELRVLGLGRLLGDHADGRSVAPEGLLDEPDRSRPPHVDGDHGGREQDRIPQREEG